MTTEGSATLASESLVVVMMNLLLLISPQGAGLLLRMAFQSEGLVTPCMYMGALIAPAGEQRRA
jgi:hypothetical protein